MRATWMTLVLLGGLAACGEEPVDNTCQSDADCSDNFTCEPLAEQGSIDANGCIDRCETDAQCVAGYICLSDGTCG